MASDRYDAFAKYKNMDAGQLSAEIAALKKLGDSGSDGTVRTRKSTITRLEQMLAPKQYEATVAADQAVMNDPNANIFDKYNAAQRMKVAADQAVKSFGRVSDRSQPAEYKTLQKYASDSQKFGGNVLDAIGNLVAKDPNNPVIVDQVNKYNAGGADLNPAFADYFQRHNNYFKQGQAAPGKLTTDLMQSAEKQWSVDRAPSGFDRAMGQFVQVAAPIMAGVVMGPAGIYAAGAASGATSSAMKGGSLEDIVKGGITGAATAGALNYAAQGIGGMFGPQQLTPEQLQTLQNNPDALKAYADAGMVDPKAYFKTLPAEAQKAYLDAGFTPEQIGGSAVYDATGGAAGTASSSAPASTGLRNAVDQMGGGLGLRGLALAGSLGGSTTPNPAPPADPTNGGFYQATPPISLTKQVATAPTSYGGPETLYFENNAATSYYAPPSTLNMNLPGIVGAGIQVMPAAGQPAAPVAMAEGGVVESTAPGIGALAPRLIKGDGDGMSDDVAGNIVSDNGGEPVLVADGEYIVPADVVSHLGNGSTDAGAKALDALMARIRKERTGKGGQAKQIDTKGILSRV